MYEERFFSLREIHLNKRWRKNLCENLANVPSSEIEKASITDVRGLCVEGTQSRDHYFMPLQKGPQT